jgi:peptidoglycan hydrolase CwlO-like protein
MKMAGLRLVLSALSCALIAQQTSATSVAPVQKVLQMMSEMKAKGEAGMELESKTYAAYAEWVSDQETELGFEIKTSNSDIEKLLAEIAKADDDVEKLGAAITGLEDETAVAEKEQSDATTIREKEHAEYVTLSTDYSESVDALKRAIQTMESKNYDVPQAMALMQKMAEAKTGMRRVLAAFLQEKEEASKGGPAVAAYEFQSGGIVQLLEKFLNKFEKELEEVESEESNQAHNFDAEMIHLTDEIAYLKKEIEEKSVFKAKRASESAAAKSELASTRKNLAEDETTLKDMKATFVAKTDTFKANQEVRKQELAAIAKAIEIISDPSVSQSYGKHINLAQKPSFLQMRSVRSRVGARQRVAIFLKKKAQLLASTALKTIADQVTSNPFDKVIQMIKDLVEKLKEEAAAEAEHKQWCDEQLKTNKIKREKKTTKVNKLTATVDSLTSTISSMAEKIATLSKEQAELTKAMGEASEQRQKEKATNTATMEDAAAGEEATKQALVVLKEFYASQSAFIQQVPEMAAYKGMQSAKGGVVGMLEVISSDFARLLADTKAAEFTATSEYNSFMKDAKASKKAKHDLEVKTKLQKDQKEFEKSQTKKDLAATQTELDKAFEYQQHLKPVCLEVHVSYEERVTRRKEEIEALKEAYKILDQK